MYALLVHRRTALTIALAECCAWCSVSATSHGRDDLRAVAHHLHHLLPSGIYGSVRDLLRRRARRPRRRDGVDRAMRTHGLSRQEPSQDRPRAGRADRARRRHRAAVYQEPVGEHWQIFCCCRARSRGEPYQRDVSPTHVKRLTDAVRRVDPSWTRSSSSRRARACTTPNAIIGASRSTS